MNDWWVYYQLNGVTRLSTGFATKTDAMLYVEKIQYMRVTLGWDVQNVKILEGGSDKI